MGSDCFKPLCFQVICYPTVAVRSHSLKLTLSHTMIMMVGSIRNKSFWHWWGLGEWVEQIQFGTKDLSSNPLTPIFNRL